MMRSLYVVSLGALVRREIHRFLRMPVQTLLQPLISTLLYFLIFGKAMGERIETIHGFRYVAYISPALIMMSIVMHAFVNVSSSLYGMRFQKSIEELLVSPMPNFLILLGFILGGVVRGVLVGTLVTLLALCFTSFPLPHLGILVVISLSTALLFSLAGFANALFGKNFDDISVIPAIILTPLTYLGGFYPIDALSPFWRKVSFFNPFVYIVDVFRYALLGISDMPIAYALCIVWFCCLALIGLNLYLLYVGKGLRQ